MINTKKKNWYIEPWSQRIGSGPWSQQIHKSHIIGNQDHQKLKKKNRERERNNILCVRKLCTEGERALEIYSKKMRIRIAKNKGR